MDSGLQRSPSSLRPTAKAGRHSRISEPHRSNDWLLGVSCVAVRRTPGETSPGRVARFLQESFPGIHVPRSIPHLDRLNPPENARRSTDCPEKLHSLSPADRTVAWEPLARRGETPQP